LFVLLFLFSFYFFFFFSSRRRHTRFSRDWSSDVCSSDLCACAASTPRRSFPQTPPPPQPVSHFPSWPVGDTRATFRYVARRAAEIGRASCRERVESAGGAVAVKKKKRERKRQVGNENQKD